MSDNDNDKLIDGILSKARELEDEQKKLIEKGSAFSLGASKDFEKSNDLIDQLHTDIMKMEKKSIMSTFVAKKKTFVVKDKFETMSKLVEDGKVINGNPENHFGAGWFITVKRQNNHIGVFLSQEVLESNWTWVLSAKMKVQVCNKTIEKKIGMIFDQPGSRGKKQFVGWSEELLNNVMCIEIEAEIRQIGRNVDNEVLAFDGSSPFWDVKLLVQGRTFYLNKKNLALRCTFFETLFFTNCKEADNSDEPIDFEMDSFDFQKFMEIVYGIQNIQHEHLEGILLIAKMFESPFVIKACERFMLNNYLPMSSDRIFEIAVEYEMDEVIKKCVSQSDKEQICKWMNGNVNAATSKELFNRYVSLTE